MKRAPKLAAAALATGRILRSGGKVERENGKVETVSKYFVAEILEPKVKSKKAKKEPKLKTESKPKAESKSTIEAKLEIESKPKAESKLEIESKPKAESKLEIEPKPKAESKLEIESKPKVESKPKIVSKVIESKPKRRRSLEIKYDEKKKGAADTGQSNGWTPDNWQETLEHVREMRKYSTAPVDDMGCHTCADPDASPPVSRYQCLVALMLSSQTKDQVTHAAMQRLKAHGCNPENILGTPDDVLGKLIYPVGFWKQKVGYIKRSSEILVKKYNGDIPRTIEGLCSLPGVGPKMGHICMQVAWDETSGIGVDTHVHRICNRLGWVRRETKTPEGTRKELESWLPKELWSQVNHLLVGFGQEICLPRFPKCAECLNRKICPYAKGKRKD